MARFDQQGALWVINRKRAFAKRGFYVPQAMSCPEIWLQVKIELS